MNHLKLSFAGVTVQEYRKYIVGGASPPKGLSEKISRAREMDGGALLKILREQRIGYVTIDDADYPALLKEIYDPPYILYYRGDPALFSYCKLAVVGSRKAGFYTRRALDGIIPGLAKEITIVSGLAYGADAIAHETAMKGDKKTIGVLAFGHDVHYPKSTQHVRTLMETHHLVVSEYPPGTSIEKWRFVARNRIIAGMSVGVLVTEAEVGGGSMITLEMALDENRIGFCIPGNIHSPLSKGTNIRIQDGAKMVLGPGDIMEEIFIGQQSK